MNGKIESLKRKIDGCKELLTVFQDERKAYQTDSSVGINRVMAFLERKKSLVSLFEAARTPDAAQDADEPADMELLRVMRGELSTLLEQLLVIDNENEKLLRRVLNGSGSVAAAPQSFARPRPALQQRLPFCPSDARRMSPVAVQPIAIQSAAARQAQRMPRTQLRQYIDADAFADRCQQK